MGTYTPRSPAHPSPGSGSLTVRPARPGCSPCSGTHVLRPPRALGESRRQRPLVPASVARPARAGWRPRGGAPRAGAEVRARDAGGGTALQPAALSACGFRSGVGPSGPGTPSATEAAPLRAPAKQFSLHTAVSPSVKRGGKARLRSPSGDWAGV